MEHSAVVAKLAAADAPALSEVLKHGETVIGRVVRAADSLGDGEILVSGSVIQAKIPRGACKGDRLVLKVDRRQSDKLELRLDRDDAISRVPLAVRSRAAGRMATRGRSTAIKVALALRPDGAIELPNGDVAQLRIPDRDLPEKEERKEGDEEEMYGASFTLHSPRLGPISVEILLAPGAVAAHVLTAPEAEQRIGEAQDDLLNALEQALNRPASVTVAARGEGDMVPQPPRIEIEPLDAYA